MVGSMVLWVGFVLQTQGISDKTGKFLPLLSRDDTDPKLLLLPTPPAMGWECTREWTQPSQMTSADPRDIPEYLMPCSAHKAGEGGRV